MSDRRRPVDRPRRAALDVLTAVRVDEAYANLVLPQMRGNLPPGSFMEFPFEVVESMFNFRPNDVVARIAPRPLLILHPAVDSVTPTQQSIEIFRHARMPADLHLFAGIDHFIFSDDNTPVLNLVRDWLDRNAPAVSPTLKENAA